MSKKTLLVSLLSLALAVVSVAVSIGVAHGDIFQAKIVAIKQDPGGGFDNTDLNDTYRFRLLNFNDFETVDRDAGVIYGQIEFQGNGTWTGSSTAFASNASTEANVLNGTYSVNPDGSFDLVVVETAPDPNLTFTGYISRDADRQLIVLNRGETAGGEISQAILTGVRATAAPLNSSDLNGDWQFRDLEIRNFEDISTDASVCRGTLNCNNGNWEIVYDCFESDGSVDSGSEDGTYVVNGNAFDFSITGELGVAFSAYLSRDKEILILTRGKGPPSISEITQWIGTALKVDPLKTYTEANLNASYSFVMLEFEDYGSNEMESNSVYGEMNFHGDFTWDGSASVFEGDGSTDSFPMSGTYLVDPDGSFSVWDTSEDPLVTLTGNISSNPDTLILTREEDSRYPTGGAGSDGGGGG